MWLAIVLLGCDGDTDTLPHGSPTTLDTLQRKGYAEVCLSSSAEQEPAPPDCAIRDELYEVSGTLTLKGSEQWGAYELADCKHGAAQVYEILDGEGATWYLGWRLTDDNDDNVGLDPGIELGTEVTLTALTLSYGEAAFLLRDPQGLVLAIDSEAVTDWMDEEHLGDLQVDWGTPYGTAVDGDCAWQATNLFLTGDGTAELYPGDSDGLSVAGQAMHAQAFSLYRDPTDATCPKSRAFALYR